MEIRTIQVPVDADFESCDDCIHFEDPIEFCIMRKCVHAICLEERYVPRERMTREERRYQKAIKMLAEECRKAQAAWWVEKPLAYALYQVWKYFDAYERPRTAEGRANEP